ncbi:enoyl-CoA hydratase/isomerase family protein [Rhizobium sp. C4]|uniref:enoyl-CoA hydratase/isomerase family protein n=1 Tax=Rhizobium sp. C4 TaxID=1349800 RepID=UPI001E2954B8|nr:enoyl-CoA hydratase/isomerase family protein [Rhizobium sp. C4]MCD2174339.1 enoyl-CoA hydratase/isomerase family protein [Rhizobium sp. C4]
MGDVITRIEGRAGVVTLSRPKALNALSHPMSLTIEAALDAWRDNADVALVILEAEGEKAFCAGGDIASIYHQSKAGELQPARDFWREEYRLNVKIAEYPKPILSFMQGFIMGGGVGLGCHGSHRIVGDTSKVAMPECGIGLIPDVGGSLILARAPGRVGEYVGLTGERLNAADAILAGFANLYVPETDWPALKAALIETGDASLANKAGRQAERATLPALMPMLDRVFSAETLTDILKRLDREEGEAAEKALAAIRRASPISLAATLEIVRRARGFSSVREAVALEYRFTWRSHEKGDFVEGIRAQLIDKDRNPRWKHPAADAVPADYIAMMLASLGENDIR